MYMGRARADIYQGDLLLQLALDKGRIDAIEAELTRRFGHLGNVLNAALQGQLGGKKNEADEAAEAVKRAEKKMKKSILGIQRQYEELTGAVGAVGLSTGEFAQELASAGRVADRFARDLLRVTDEAAKSKVKFGEDRAALEDLRLSLKFTAAQAEDYTRQKRILTQETAREQRALQSLENRLKGLGRLVGAVGGKNIAEKIMGDPALLRQYGRELLRLNEYFVRMGKNALLTNEEVALLRGQLDRMSGDTIPKLIRKVRDWLIATGIVFAVINAFRELFRTIGEVDSAVADLQKVMKSNANQQQNLNILLKEARKAAMDYGANLVDVLHIQRDWYRQFQDVRATVNLTKVSLLAMNIAELSVEDSTRLLTSTMRQFGIATSDAIDILDVWNALSNKAGVSTKAVAEATVRAGAAFKGAGGSLQELAGLAAAAIKATGRSGQQVGTLLKTLSAYYVRPETVKAVREITNISILRQKGQLMDFMDFLGRLAAKWDSLTEAQKASVSMAVAGSRRYSGLQAILRQWEQVLHDVGIAYDSVGSAQRENTTFMKHQERQVTRLKAALQTLAVSFSDATGLGKSIILAARSLANMTKGMAEASAETMRMRASILVAIIAFGLLVPRVRAAGAAIAAAFKAAAAGTTTYAAAIGSIVWPVAVAGALAAAIGYLTKKFMDHNAALEDLEDVLDRVRTKAELEHDKRMQEIGDVKNAIDKLKYYKAAITELQNVKNRTAIQEKKLNDLRAHAKQLLEALNGKPLGDHVNLLKEINNALSIQIGLYARVIEAERNRLKAADEAGRAAEKSLKEEESRRKSLEARLSSLQSRLAAAKKRPMGIGDLYYPYGPYDQKTLTDEIRRLRKEKEISDKRIALFQSQVEAGRAAHRAYVSMIGIDEPKHPAKSPFEDKTGKGAATRIGPATLYLRFLPTKKDLDEIERRAQALTKAWKQTGRKAIIAWSEGDKVMSTVIAGASSQALSQAVQEVSARRRKALSEAEKAQREEQRRLESIAKDRENFLKTLWRRNNELVDKGWVPGSVLGAVAGLAPPSKDTFATYLRDLKKKSDDVHRQIEKAYRDEILWWYDFIDKIKASEEKLKTTYTVETAKGPIPLTDVIKENIDLLEKRREELGKTATENYMKSARQFLLKYFYAGALGRVLGGVNLAAIGRRVITPAIIPDWLGDFAKGAALGTRAIVKDRQKRAQAIKKATQTVIDAYLKTQRELEQIGLDSYHKRLAQLQNEVEDFRKTQADETAIAQYEAAQREKILREEQERIRKENYRTFTQVRDNIARVLSDSLANASSFADGMKRILRSIVLESIRQRIMESPVVGWLSGVLSKEKMKPIPKVGGGSYFGYVNPLAWAAMAAAVAKSRAKKGTALEGGVVPPLATSIPGAIPAYKNNAINVRIVDTQVKRGALPVAQADPRTGKPMQRKLPFKDVIGGSMGATISQLAGAYGIYQGGDAISGTLLGYTLTGGPIGAVVGGLLGLLGGRRRKKREAALRAQQEAERKRQERLSRRVLAPFDVAFQGIQYLPSSAQFGGRGNALSGRLGGVAPMTVATYNTISVNEVKVEATGDAREAGRQFVSGIQEEALARGIRFTASSGLSRAAVPAAF